MASKGPRPALALAIAVGAAILAAATAWAMLGASNPLRRADGTLVGSVQIGGPFKLTSHRGEPFDSATLKGRPYAIFFGFTRCPDVCPTTLLEMTNHLQALGVAADKLAVLFVTVDPTRDDAAFLKEYLASFDPRIVGLTGTEARIADVTRAYRAVYEKVPGKDGNYTFNHSASVFLFDAAGKFAGTLNYTEGEAAQRAKLKRLVEP